MRRPASRSPKWVCAKQQSLGQRRIRLRLSAVQSGRCVSPSCEAPRSKGVTRCRIGRSEANGNTEWSLRGEAGKTSFVDGGKAGCDLGDSTRYLYRVTAINRFGAVGTPSAKNSSCTAPGCVLDSEVVGSSIKVCATSGVFLGEVGGRAGRAAADAVFNTDIDHPHGRRLIFRLGGSLLSGRRGQCCPSGASGRWRARLYRALRKRRRSCPRTRSRGICSGL